MRKTLPGHPLEDPEKLFALITGAIAARSAECSTIPGF